MRVVLGLLTSFFLFQDILFTEPVSYCAAALSTSRETGAILNLWGGVGGSVIEQLFQQK